jgi:3-deoxy-D-manno-octulosonic-acid transferase
MWLLYQLATTVALILAAPFLLLGRRGHYLPTIQGRLGLAHPPPAGEQPLWIHAVSVGEVGVADTLIQALPKELPLLVTTVTPTGQARAKARLADRATVTYLPFELGCVVRRFYDRFTPRGLVLVEGDLWPLVLREAKRRQLPVVVVNGRVGDSSYRRMHRLRGLLSPLFGPVRRFAVQGARDRRRLEDLGVEPQRIAETGSLKFDTPPPPQAPAAEQLVRRLADGRPVLLAGSTMAGEEAAALAGLSGAGGGDAALLVIAPRHPERWDEVAQLLAQQKVDFTRRSEPAAGGRPAVLLLDSLGELAGLYRLASAAFIGGTLVPTGGHNPLEAARFAVPVAVGPSMENFADIAARFDDDSAWARVSDGVVLGEVWRRWLAAPDEAAALGERGRQLVEANRGALQRTLELLAPLTGEAPPTGTPLTGAEPSP